MMLIQEKQNFDFFKINSSDKDKKNQKITAEELILIVGFIGLALSGAYIVYDKINTHTTVNNMFSHTANQFLMLEIAEVNPKEIKNYNMNVRQILKNLGSVNYFVETDETKYEIGSVLENGKEKWIMTYKTSNENICNYTNIKIEEAKQKSFTSNGFPILQFGNKEEFTNNGCKINKDGTYHMDFKLPIGQWKRNQR